MGLCVRDAAFLGVQLADGAAMLQPVQAPLIFWAFAVLGHCPAPAVLVALEAQVRSLSSHLTAQVPTQVPFPKISEI